MINILNSEIIVEFFAGVVLIGSILGTVAFCIVAWTPIQHLFSCHDVKTVQTFTGIGASDFPLSANIICTKGYVVEKYSDSQIIYGCLTLENCAITEKHCLIETTERVCDE